MLYRKGKISESIWVTKGSFYSRSDNQDLIVILSNSSPIGTGMKGTSLPLGVHQCFCVFHFFVVEVSTGRKILLFMLLRTFEIDFQSSE